MRQDLNLTVAQIAMPLNAYRIVNAVFLIPAGVLLDRIGPTMALRTSIILAATMGLLFPLCSSLSHLVLLQVLFAATKLFGGLTAMLLLINRAFGSQSSGISTATSVLLSGYSLAGFIAPTVVGALCQSMGWRFASGTLSVLFAVIGVPLTLLYLRDIPTPRVGDTVWTKVSSVDHLENDSSTSSKERQTLSTSAVNEADDPRAPLSLSEDGVKADVANVSGTAPEPLFSDRYCTLAAVVTALSLSMHIVLDHLLVFLREDFGLGFNKSTMFVSGLNLIALFAKLVVGPLGDRHDKGLLIAIFGSVAALACLFLIDFGSAGSFAVTRSLSKVSSFVFFCKLHVRSTSFGCYVSGISVLHASLLRVALEFANICNIARVAPLTNTNCEHAHLTAAEFRSDELCQTLMLGLFFVESEDAIGYAAVFSLTTASLPEHGSQNLGLRANINMMLLFASGSLGSFLASSLRTAYGSYKWAFILNSAVWLFVVLGGLMLRKDLPKGRVSVSTASGELRTTVQKEKGW